MINPRTGQLEPIATNAGIMGKTFAQLGHYAPPMPQMVAPQAQMQPQSMINRNFRPFQYNAPSANQLFPNLTMPSQAQGMPQGLPFQGGGFPGQGNTMMGGNFGAGRFLGQGYGNQSGLLGSSSTSMLGT